MVINIGVVESRLLKSMEFDLIILGRFFRCSHIFKRKKHIRIQRPQNI